MIEGQAPPSLANAVLAGDRRAGARLITRAETGDPEIAAIIGSLHASGGHARTIGFTGPPGVGKSTLIDALTARYRQMGFSIAILAIDPSSARTGGALLGDRVRMGRHVSDPGVFIRSMATRGRLGGLAAATGDALTVLDAMGFDIIFVETVGVGQNEIAIVDHVDVVLLLQTAQSGDRIQTMKAGVAEIGDILLVNKADNEGSLEALRQLNELIGDRPLHPDHWSGKALAIEAATGRGIEELLSAIDEYFAHQRENPVVHRERLRRQGRARILEIARSQLTAKIFQNDSRLVSEAVLDSMIGRLISPHSVARTFFHRGVEADQR